MCYNYQTLKERINKYNSRNLIELYLANQMLLIAFSFQPLNP